MVRIKEAHEDNWTKEFYAAVCPQRLYIIGEGGDKPKAANAAEPDQGSPPHDCITMGAIGGG